MVHIEEDSKSDAILCIFKKKKQVGIPFISCLKRAFLNKK